MGPLNALKLVAAYSGEKIIHKSLFRDQKALIHHFNFLLNAGMEHVSEAENQYVAKHSKYGKIVIRKYPSSDPVVIKQVFLDGEYDALAQLVGEKLKPGKITMIDGGANIGLTSISLRTQLLPRFELHSVLVEPFADNVSQVKANIELQGIKTFTVLKAGIYNKQGYLEIANTFRDKLEWSVQIEESPVPTDLPAIEITGIMEANNWDMLDILKLDIEGAERHLFASPDYAASILERVRLLAVELHEEYVDTTSTLDLLARLGFKLKKSGELYIGYNGNLLE